MQERTRQQRQLRFVSGAVILAFALAGCSNPSSAEGGPQANPTQSQAEPGESPTATTSAPHDSTQPDLLGSESAIVDICAWLHLERTHMDVGEKSAVITAQPDGTLSVTCSEQPSGWIGEVSTVSLIIGDVSRINSGRDLVAVEEHRGFSVVRDSANYVMQAQLSDNEVLRIETVPFDDAIAPNDEWHIYLLRDMLDAWAAQRVPYFLLGAEANVRDPWNICRHVADDVLAYAATHGTLGAQPYVLVTEASDWNGDPTYTCTARPSATHDSETDIEIEVELTWAPSEGDANMGGNFASAGCEPGTRPGVMVACQPGWIFYATTQGRWLIMVDVDDRNLPKSFVNTETVSVQTQRDVEAFAGRVADSLTGVSLGSEVERRRDPRRAEVSTSVEPPVSVSCLRGIPFATFQSDSATLLLCTEPAKSEHTMVGTINGESFTTEHVYGGQLSGEALVSTATLNYELRYNDYSIAAYNDGGQVFREYVNVVWWEQPHGE